MAKRVSKTPPVATPEELEIDLHERWRRAVALAADIRREWEEQNEPKIIEWHNNTLSEHPLLKLLREAEKDALAAAKAIGKPAKPNGRPSVAVPKPIEITESPAVRRRRMHVAS